MLIITLSSIPPRFAHLGPTLHSLLAQTTKADRIILYIPETYRRFPDWDGSLPGVPDGVEIRRVTQDLGPATKILHACEDFKDTECDILFCDDDRLFAPDWSSHFTTARAERPHAAIALRGLFANHMVGTTDARKWQPRARVKDMRRDWDFKRNRLKRALRAVLTLSRYRPPERVRFDQSGYMDMFEGCAGVMIKPHFLDRTAWDIPPIAWGVDDVWLSAMMAARDHPVWVVANVVVPENTDAQRHQPLADAQIAGATRREANLATIRHVQAEFGVWLG